MIESIETDPPSNRQRWPITWICVALAAMTFAVFAPALRHGFVNFDDDVYVYKNPRVTNGLSLGGLSWVFTHADCSLYHPLTMLSLMADYQLHKLNPGGYHLANLLLHTSSVVLLFLILWRMTGALWRGAFVAAVFAIHPLRVESVAWVAERKDVLSAFFFMLTLGAYVRYARSANSLARYLMVAFTFLLALLSKPTVVTLPFLLLLLDYWPLRRVESPGRLLLEKLPFLALAAAVCAMTFLAAGQFIASHSDVSMPLRIANALVSYVVYLRQMVWPEALAASYPFPYHGVAAWKTAGAAILLAAISAVAFWRRRKEPWLLSGWLWYAGMLLPMAGLVQVGRQAHADRYTYLPQIGIYMAITWLVAERAAKWQLGRAILTSLMIGVIATMAICSWKQIAYWQNSETLWAHTLACTTNNEVAHWDLGRVAMQDKDRPAEAIAHFEAALKIDPYFFPAWNDLGLVLLENGRIDEAIPRFQQAEQIAPDQADPFFNLGNAFRRKGWVDDAIAQYEQAVQIKPDLAEAHDGLGLALFDKGRVDDAIFQYREALKIQSGDADTHFHLGNALRQKGDTKGAIAEFEETLRLKPSYWEARNNFAITLRQTGRVDDAIAQYQKTLEIMPENASIQVNLANALLEKGAVDQAISHYRQALKIQPASAEEHFHLGDALRRKGSLNEAISEYKEALRLKPSYGEAHNNLGTALRQMGRVDEAITQYEMALEIMPDESIHVNLANAFLQKGRPDQAILHFQNALHEAPSDLEVVNNLAWLLATCAQAPLRNGSQGLQLARRANELAGGKNPVVLGTLAATLAETGQFSEAAQTAQKAIDLARAAGQRDLAARLNGELQLYTAGRPFHQP